MKINQLALSRLDCSEKKNRKLLMSYLKKIKYFKDKEATYENLEKAFWMARKKSKYSVSAILVSCEGTFTAFCETSKGIKFQITSHSMKEIFIKFIVISAFKKISKGGG